jgi:hypothetical protein
MVGSPDLCAALYALGRAMSCKRSCACQSKAIINTQYRAAVPRVCAATLLKMIVID